MTLQPHHGRRRAAGTRVGLCLLMAAAVLIVSGPVRAQSAAGDDAGDRAAFVYRFAEFVGWPQGQQGSALVIGILGDAPLVAAVAQAVHGRTIDGRTVVVRPLTSAAQVPGCQIAYIGGNDPAVIQNALRAAGDASVLTMSTAPGFETLGGIVQLMADDDGWRFAVNYPAAGRAGLWISSQLLNLTVADVSRRP